MAKKNQASNVGQKGGQMNPKGTSKIDPKKKGSTGCCGG